MTWKFPASHSTSEHILSRRDKPNEREAYEASRLSIPPAPSVFRRYLGAADLPRLFEYVPSRDLLVEMDRFWQQASSMYGYFPLAGFSLPLLFHENFYRFPVSFLVSPMVPTGKKFKRECHRALSILKARSVRFFRYT